ncbi:hypothetical protein BDQ17DRAFT_1251265 [Cyathus striatus]|nr:hypothetical protein BDQ17DRAFT_1251265 [Cyathus striatus]
MTQIKASGEIREASSSASDNPARKRRKLDTAVSKSCIEKLTTKDPAKGNAKGKRKEKDNSKKLPHEYAQFLVDRAKEEPLGKKRPQFLEGKTIFYTGGDFRQASATTRARMELIIKHGGTLAPKFDPSTVTHVIACCTLGTAVDAMGLKSWREIPDHIPTVNWNWVADSLCIKEMTKEEFDEHQIFQYAAFVERIDVGVEKYPRRTRSNHSNLGEGTSNRKEKNIEIPQTGYVTVCICSSLPAHAAPACDAAGPRRSPACTPPSPTPPNHRGSCEVELQPSSPVSSVCPLPVTDKDDPLAEYYLQALAEHDAQSGRPGEEESDNDDDDDDNTTPVINPTPKRGWTCDQKRVQIKNCPNQDVIDKLEELKNLHDVKPGQDEKWRVFTYSKCIPALRIYPKRIKSFSEARSIRGVGDKTARKIMEIITTGNLSRIDYEKTEDVQVTRLFTGIYGVGQPTAYKWYAAGCRTLDDLKAGKCGVKLTPAQEIGLRYYDDINDRMPRTEAKAIFDLIKPIALSIDSKLFVEIMGSYRRGKADCGDIDILITRKPEGDTTHAGVLSRLLQKLHKVGILTEDLALPDHPDDLEAIYRGLCHLPTSGSRRRRIDFLTVPWESRGAALLYYTGDDIFNRAIRLKANALGYSLNQRGLFSKVIRDPRDKRVKLNKGVLLASETEQEIFKILGVPWQEPHERIRR